MLPIIMVLAISGCKKYKGRIVVEGKVYDESNFKSISGATVYLTQREFFASFRNVVETATSDSEGNFCIIYEGDDEGFTFEVAAQKNWYYDTPEYISVKFGKKNEDVDVPLKPLGYLKLNMKNTSPFSPSDKILYRGFMYVSGSDAFFGMNVDTFDVGQVFGNTTIEISWYVTKNAITTSYSDLIYCPAFDTTSYSISY